MFGLFYFGCVRMVFKVLSFYKFFFFQVVVFKKGGLEIELIVIYFFFYLLGIYDNVGKDQLFV